jgi:SAM-dependent methyltransferase
MKRADAAYLLAHPEAKAPAAELRFAVGSPGSIPDFLEGGRALADEIERALGAVGSSPAGIREALDFGCGCGRLLIAARERWPHIHWHGCDIDQQVVAWCTANLPEATAFVNDSLPPLPLADGAVDLIWCGSVFTHLDEQRQDVWLRELCRVLRPSGWLLATVLGQAFWGSLPSRTVRQIRAKGFLFAQTEPGGWVRPPWYQTAFHTQEYVTQHWSQFFEICAQLPPVGRGQDLVVARRRAASNDRLTSEPEA